MAQLKPNFILLSETWLKKDFEDSIISLPNYTLVRTDRNNPTKSNQIGGGTCIYISDSLKGYDVHAVENNTDRLLNTNIDITSIDVHISSVKFSIICIYRPGNISNSENDILINLISNILRRQKIVYIIGDFNYPEIDWPTLTLSQPNEQAQNFLDAYKEWNVKQMICNNTRHRGEQSSLLDLVLVSDKNMITKIQDLPPLGKSDHISLLIQSYITLPDKNPTRTIYKRNFSKANYTKIIEMLRSVENIREQENETNKCVLYEKLENNIKEAIEKCVPMSKIKHNKNKPWINNNLFLEITQKRRLWNNYIHNKTNTNYALYRQSNNSLKTKLRIARKNYEHHLLESDNKKVFSYITSTLNSKIATVSLKNPTTREIVKDHTETAQLLAKQFESVFIDEPSNNMPQLTTARNLSSLETIELTIGKVQNVIKNMKSNASPGPDEIPMIFIQKTADVLSEQLANAMQESLDKGIIPTNWKNATIVPIFKKGSRFDPVNYRPISLTSATCKIMEKILANEISDFMHANKIIPKNQHGFVPGKSVITNLMLSLNDWTRAHDDGEPVDVIYLDFLKAFDRVPHDRLLYKLEHLGIRGNLHSWISCFLKNRQAVVRVNKTHSKPFKSTSGVPQGSVLGPLLFIIYISDIATGIKTSIIHFADDTKLYGDPIKQGADIQQDLDRIQEWTEKWLLALNSEKCTVVHIGYNNPRKQYFINETRISAVTQQSDLGVTISEDLKWEPHISKITKKANKMAYMFRMAFADHSKAMVLKMYKAYIRPTLDYAHCIWSPYFLKDKMDLEKAQRRITKIPPENKNSTYEQRLSAMKLTTLEARRERGDLIETYKILNGYYNCEIDFLKFSNVTWTRGHSNKLKTEKCNKLPRQNFLANRVVKMWNSLRQETISASNLNNFKNQYDKHEH